MAFTQLQNTMDKSVEIRRSVMSPSPHVLILGRKEQEKQNTMEKSVEIRRAVTCLPARVDSWSEGIKKKQNNNIP